MAIRFVPINVPVATRDAIRRKAQAEGVPMSSLIASLIADRTSDHPRPPERVPLLRSALLRLVSAYPDPDTVHAVSHLLKRIQPPADKGLRRD